MATFLSVWLCKIEDFNFEAVAIKNDVAKNGGKVPNVWGTLAAVCGDGFMIFILWVACLVFSFYGAEAPCRDVGTAALRRSARTTTCCGT